MAIHKITDYDQPLCRRVPAAIAESTTSTKHVTCKWCLRLIHAAPTDSGETKS